MPVDAAQRAAALDVSRSFCVSAPAGSGKTELLTQRFLKLLATVEEPEQVLAITFTRKARAEMTARIMRALALGQQPEPEEDYKKTTWHAAKTALAQDAARDWHLLQNPSRLRIQTIDSLNQSIAAESPLMNGFGSVPEAVDDAWPLYNKVVGPLLKLLGQDSDIGNALGQVLLVCDGDIQRFGNLLFGLLAKREQWLHYVAGAGDGEQLAAVLHASLGAWLCDDLSHAYDALLPYQGELVSCLSFAVQHSRIEALAAIEAESALPMPVEENLTNWQALVGWLLTDKNEFRKTVSEKQGFPAPSSQKDKTLKQNYADAKKRMVALLAELRERSGLAQTLAAVRLIPKQLSTAQLATVKDILLVLRYAVANLNIVFAERGECDHVQVALAAAELLRGDEAPSSAQLRWHNRVRHILIDEYQDTSLIQNEILSALIALWPEARELNPEQQRSLFIVGDGMQSIYRFRAANVGLFIQARAQGIGTEPLEVLDLKQNFRSVEAVVNGFNNIFGASFPASSDAAVGAVKYSEAAAINGEDGNIECHGFDSAAAEARYVADSIEQLLGEAPAQTIAVLAKARPHLQAISMELRERDLSFTNTDISPLAKVPAVVDAISITRWLLDANDDIAFASILRAPWCGASMADLISLKQAAPSNDLAFSSNADLSDAAEHITRCYQLLKAAWEERGRKPLADAVGGLWRALGGHLYVGEDIGFVEQYIQLLRNNAEINSYNQLEAILEKYYARPTETAANIQLMTIHKSKGLEFDSVFLVGLSNMTQSDNPGLLEYAERLHDDGMQSFLLAPWGKAEADKTLRTYVRNLERQADKHEALRVLYVGATRAIRFLSMSFTYKQNMKSEEFAVLPPPASSLLGYVWPVLANSTVLHDAETVAAENTKTEPDLKRLVGAPELSISTPTSNEVDALADEKSDTNKTAVGTIIHGFLEQLSGTIRIDVAQLLRYYEAQIDQSFAIDDKSAAKQLLRRVYENTAGEGAGSWVLQQHTNAVNEWEITAVNVDGSVRRHIIDRSFIADGQRWIIDYKVSEPSESQSDDEFLQEQAERYRPQLARYRYAVNKLQTEEGHRRPIKTALYFPLINQIHEVDTGLPNDN